MDVNRNREAKPAALRKWTLAAAALLILSIALFVAQWAVERQLAPPIEWSNNDSPLRSGIALDGDAGFIVGSKDNKIEMLDKTGQSVWTLPASGTVWRLDLSEGGDRLVAVTEDRKMIIADTATGKSLSQWDCLIRRSR